MAPAASPAPSRTERNSRALANARSAQRAGAAPATRTTGPARRKSGAAVKPSRGTKPAPRPARAATRPRPAQNARPVARALASRGMPLVDRVLRGPVWVVMLGALLAGIVFLNVSVLELNRGIAQTDAKAAALERANSGLRARVAKLDSGERIQQLAAAKGFVMPQPGDVTYLEPRSSDARLAARRMTEPADVAATTTPTTPVTPTTTVTPTTAVTPTASVTPAPATTPVAPTTAPTTTQVP
jgi:cell division protein FtsL